MDVDILSIPALAAIVAIVMGLGKVIEILILKSVPPKSVLMDEERDWMQHTYKVISRQDSDGTPLVYVPRSWAEVQKDMQQIMTQIVNDQRRIADILDRIDKKLEEK
jgi:hypothetical protein|tara:strand:- start:3066 stop:3386 length:321 start_codon:yes stop_codon:yes gene_type:complete